MKGKIVKEGSIFLTFERLDIFIDVSYLLSITGRDSGIPHLPSDFSPNLLLNTVWLTSITRCTGAEEIAVIEQYNQIPCQSQVDEMHNIDGKGVWKLDRRDSE